MPLTIRQAYEQFYEPTRPQLAPRTIERYRMEVGRWERHTMNPRIDEITTATFQQYRAACLAAKLRPTSIEAGVRTVLQVLRLCGPEQERREGLGLIPRVPFVGRPLRQTASFKPTPTIDELRIAFGFCGWLKWPPGVNARDFWQVYLGLSYVTALRVTDVLALTPPMRQGDLLIVAASKTDKEIAYPLPRWLTVIMDRLPTGEKRLLPCRRLPCFVRRELQSISAKLEITPVLPHAIRRASITAWTMLHPDCGKLIHGEGLRIRDHYVDRLALLRRYIAELPPLA